MSSDEELEHTNVRSRLLSHDGNENSLDCQELQESKKEVIPLQDFEHKNEKLDVLSDENESTSINQNAPLGRRTPPLPGLLQRIPKRHIVLGLLVLGNFNMYCIRMCLSVTIVAMTSSHVHPNETTSPDHGAEFPWSKEFQGTLLACFYWGYCAMQVPAGLLAFKFGGVFLYGIAIFGASVLTLATPFIVRQNVYIFIVLRVVEGLFLGFVAATGQTIVSKWSPIYERSIFQTFGYSGLILGTIFANLVSGLFSGSTWGWPSVFYFFGILGVLWYFLWLYMVYEDPEDHPNISDEELKIIGKHWHTKLTFSRIPWRQIFTSIPVWCLIVVNFTDCWGFYTFMLTLPSYMNDVLKFDITKIGFSSSLPYVLCVIIAPSWGYLIDTLRGRNYIGTIFARKLSVFIGMGISAIFVALIAHASTTTATMVMITIAIALTSITSSGPCVNVIEIAPKYAGVLMGIINFACNITGFIAPEVIGAITGHGDPASHWATVFYVTAGIELFGMLVFLCLASAEKQSWADE